VAGGIEGQQKRLGHSRLKPLWLLVCEFSYFAVTSIICILCSLVIVLSFFFVGPDTQK